MKFSVLVTFFVTGRDVTDGHRDRQTFLVKYYFRCHFFNNFSNADLEIISLQLVSQNQDGGSNPKKSRVIFFKPKLLAKKYGDFKGILHLFFHHAI